jgi:ADP-heptose:LPS heptosyltransferase
VGTPAAGTRVPGVRRIAVLRANAIGDFVFALPALAALRAAYPRAKIVLLARDWHARFLTGRPGPVDTVVTLPAVPGVSVAPDAAHDTHAVARCIEQLRAQRFDLALQWHGGGRYSNPFLLQVHGRVSAGLQAQDAPPLARNLAYVEWRNERLRLLEAAAQVGAAPAGLDPVLAVTPADRAAAERVLPGVERPLVVLQPGATDPRRRWPAAGFGQIGDWLVREGYAVAINGSADEQALVAQVLCGMRERAYPVAPDLCALAGLLERAVLVIGSDTGPLYLAEAVGTPTVAIYWCGNALVSGPLSGAWHRAAIAWRVDCPVCGTRNVETRCSHEASFVADVAVDEVRAHAQVLLAAARAHAARRACG